jgi:hypothetical protein
MFMRAGRGAGKFCDRVVTGFVHGTEERRATECAVYPHSEADKIFEAHKSRVLADGTGSSEPLFLTIPEK